MGRCGYSTTTRDAGRLPTVSELQRALADEIRAEMSRQRITRRDMERRTDTKPASWGNYFVGVNREVPFPVIEAVCRELGIAPSAMIARAEAASARPVDHEAMAEQAIAGMSPAAAEQVRRAAASIRPRKPNGSGKSDAV